MEPTAFGGGSRANPLSRLAMDASFKACIRVLVDRLSQIASPWALTGSAGHVLQGLEIPMHDVDVQTTERGAYWIEEALIDFSTRRVKFSQTQRIRSHFGEFEIERVRVEVMGGLQKRLSDGEWEPTVDIRPHIVMIAALEREVPVLNLTYERDAYAVLGREDRVREIDEFLESRIGQ